MDFFMDTTISRHATSNKYPAILVGGAFLPWAVSQVVMWISSRLWGNSALNLSLIIATLFSFLWLTATIKYCSRVQTRKARWLFSLSPIAFWPLLLFLIFVIGVFAGGGNW